MIQRRLLELLPQLFKLAARAGAGRTAFKVAFNLKAADQIQLSIHVTMEEILQIITIHA